MFIAEFGWTIYRELSAVNDVTFVVPTSLVSDLNQKAD